MSLMTNSDLRTRLNSKQADQIFIDPLLSDDQVGAVSIDLRLGGDFLVSVLNHKPSIVLKGDDGMGSHIESFFQSTRRDIGDAFLIHPSQVVLATTLEYVGLPNDVYADLNTRSSYHRLGISVSSVFQPGFRGCLSLEIVNNSNIPVELIVGSRVVQTRFYKNNNEEEYFRGTARRKYIGQVRPTISRAERDSDLSRLKDISNKTTA